MKIGFNNTVQERDMDLLFLSAIISDKDFAKMIVGKTKYAGQDFEVITAEVSHTELDLGESDISVIFDFSGKKVGFLLEDKIDAKAMPEQHERYHKRAEKAISRGEYSEYEVFIVCPGSYYEINDEAKKYENVLKYEESLEYFKSKDDELSRFRAQQIEQTINSAKNKSPTVLNKAANSFFKEYKKYQIEHYPSLDMRTKETSNGYWVDYGTRLGIAYIDHKLLEGSVDLTFSKAKAEMVTVERLAIWLQKHGFPGIQAVPTKGEGAMLRIKVPSLENYSDFKDVDYDALNKCFQAISELTDFANMIEDGYQLRNLKGKKQKH